MGGLRNGSDGCSIQRFGDPAERVGGLPGYSCDHASSPHVVRSA